jgi:pyruvate kinase
MVRIANYIEEHKNKETTLNIQAQTRKAIQHSVFNAVSYSACLMAEDLGAAAIITPSNSGSTARMVARFRPDCPIIAPTTDEHTFHQLGLSRGVVPLRMEMCEGTDELIRNAVEGAQKAGLVQTGDVVIVVAGIPTGVSGTTNMIKAHIVGDVLIRGIGVGEGKAYGRVCNVTTASDMAATFQDGDIIVAKMTTKEMLPYLRKAAAVIVETTDENSHAVVTCQALGIPVIMDRFHVAVHMLKDGTTVTVDAHTGFIFNGVVK